jgi:hypothetical protein
MKMVECMEDETPTHPKGEIGSKVTQKMKLAQVMEARVTINVSGAKESSSLQMTRKNR